MKINTHRLHIHTHIGYQDRNRTIKKDRLTIVVGQILAGWTVRLLNFTFFFCISCCRGLRPISTTGVDQSYQPLGLVSWLRYSASCRGGLVWMVPVGVNFILFSTQKPSIFFLFIFFVDRMMIKLQQENVFKVSVPLCGYIVLLATFDGVRILVAPLLNLLQFFISSRHNNRCRSRPACSH